MGAAESGSPAVHASIRVRSTPEVVWDAWARPEELAQWFADEVRGTAERGSTVTWVFDALGYRIPVPVLDARRPELLVFGGGPPGAPPIRQEIRIARVGSEVELGIVHSGFPEGPAGDVQRESVRSGWSLALATLKHWIDRGRPRERVHLFAFREARYSSERILELYTTAKGLTEWLALSVEPEGVPWKEGTSFRMDLGEETAVQGEVLVRTAQEVLLSLREDGALLGLKAFPLGPDRRAVALDFNGWGLEPRRRNEIASLMERAADRLVARLGT